MKMQDLFSDPSHIYNAMHYKKKYTEFHFVFLRSGVYNYLKNTQEI